MVISQQERLRKALILFRNALGNLVVFRRAYVKKLPGRAELIEIEGLLYRGLDAMSQAYKRSEWCTLHREARLVEIPVSSLHSLAEDFSDDEEHYIAEKLHSKATCISDAYKVVEELAKDTVLVELSENSETGLKDYEGKNSNWF